MRFLPRSWFSSTAPFLFISLPFNVTTPSETMIFDMSIRDSESSEMMAFLFVAIPDYACSGSDLPQSGLQSYDLAFEPYCLRL
jgi:hypothetical protein